jgi:anti-anti-sigma regulatory factor
MDAWQAKESPGSGFGIYEHDHPGGPLRLMLLGRLDEAAADRLDGRLEPLRQSGRWVQVDLSELQFIEPAGAEAVLAALTEARRIGWRLEVAYVPGEAEGMTRRG